MDEQTVREKRLKAMEALAEALGAMARMSDEMPEALRDRGEPVTPNAVQGAKEALHWIEEAAGLMRQIAGED